MEGYGYPFPPPFPPMRASEMEYPDRGDGYAEYYGMGPLKEERDHGRSRSKHRTRKRRDTIRSKSRSSGSKSRSASRSRTRSRSHSQSRSRSKSRSKSRSRSRSRSRTRSVSRRRASSFREPSFLDAFRVLYLTPVKHKKSTTKYLATKKRQDRIQELLKSDGLGSKRWFFYPRSRPESEPAISKQLPSSRISCDQRIKVDGEFLRKYKRSKKVDLDAPIVKLKRWELLFYEKLGFIQAV